MSLKMTQLVEKCERDTLLRRKKINVDGREVVYALNGMF